MTRLLVVVACCVAIVGWWSVAAAGAEKAEKPETNVYCVGEVNALLTASNQARLEKYIAKWRDGPSYLLPGLLEDLASRINPDNIILGRDETWKKEAKDVGQVEGRAAWAIEQLTGLDLPKVNLGSTKEDLIRIREEVDKLVGAYNAGFIAATCRIKPERTLDELMKDYRGKIKTGPNQEDYEASFCLMAQLFEEWCPLGKKLSDLEDIVGSQGEPNERLGCVDYYFVSGNLGAVYRLRVANGIIVSVSAPGWD